LSHLPEKFKSAAMKRILILALLLTVGCSTTIREMRDHTPRATYYSSRPVAELQHCLAGNLSWIAAPSIIPGDGSTELSFGGGGTTAVLVTLRPTKAGSTVEVREGLAYGARVRNNIEACVSGRDA
jgi:hypothetical protein